MLVKVIVVAAFESCWGRTPNGIAELLSAHTDQRHGRGIQQQDSADQIERTRLSIIPELPHSHLVLLRQTRPATGKS